MDSLSAEPARPSAPAAQPRPFTRRRKFQLAALALIAAGAGLFMGLYLRYAFLIQEKLGDGVFETGTLIYSAPHVLRLGQEATRAGVIGHLHRGGYRENGQSRLGSYRTIAQGLEITTGPDSYFGPHTAELHFSKGRLSRVYSRTNGADSSEYQLEPELITNLVQGHREKRRPVGFAELPQHLVNAILAVEDKRFFNHGGVDVIRLVKAAYVDIREGRKEQGASTLTMQLARSFWLDQEKTWTRKFSEALLTCELERRFSKQQIFEFYANQVYLGRRGSFSIHGFGQAAESYFGKPVGRLSIPEAAMLVGIVQRPSYYNPFRYPERVRARRNLVLSLMHTNGFLSPAQLAAAVATPIRLQPGESESSDAPFFVDLVNAELERTLEDRDFDKSSHRVYTSLNAGLQRDAVEAVRAGMQEVDANVMQLRRRRRGPRPKLPQVALVALDARTGAVKALVGGRSYAQSQLNRALAKRQPGSSFKPFVYAAALSTALDPRARNVITPATVVEDEPTTFRFDNQTYQPGNFHDQFYGAVTVRQALTKSLNIPAVKIAERAGFRSVAELARRAGLENQQATPSLALGAYEVSPLDIAEAYTIFSNYGRHERRRLLTAVRDRKVRTVYADKPVETQVLDPRVAYLMINMMEDVVRYGTAAGVRSRGFALPAAGKTGTSRDGWFAGFTSELICVVWVGYDDGSELHLEGSKSALPVWTAFMQRAHERPEYRDAKPFPEPEGIVKVAIDPESGQLADEWCPSSRTEMFVAGTQPRAHCELHALDYEIISRHEEPKKNVFGRILGIFR